MNNNNLRTWVRGGSSKGKAGYWLAFDYNTDIIQRIKETVPSYLREWNAEKKEWWISEFCEKQINDIFKGFLDAVRAQRRLF